MERAETGQCEQQYKNKKILAPMVRIGTLPMRLLALDYGADLVYCEEIIDRKILMCQKQQNDLLGTTDFILSDGTVVFRTCPREKESLVFQIGTCDAKRALAAAKKIEDHVCGVDVNMGCPKEFSIKGGMGAALITQPEKVKEILTTLVSGLSIPVTCKIRVLPSLEDTLHLAKVIESTGVSALAVHGRTKTERSRDPCRDDFIKAVSQSVSIPVIANGGSKAMTSADDIEAFRARTGTSSVMVARAAQWNCSVFRAAGPLPWLDVLHAYLRYAFYFDNNNINTKYCVLQMLHDKMTERPEADACLAAKTLQDFADIWKMKEEYEKILSERAERDKSLKLGDETMGAKRRKTEAGLVLIELPVRFNKRLYSTTMTPKQILNNLCKKCHFGQPVYETVERPQDRCFHSTVKVMGKLYTSPYWEKSKSPAEQSAAICCLVAMGEHDGRLDDTDSEREELQRKWRAAICGEPQSDENRGEKVSVSKPKGSGDNHKEVKLAPPSIEKAPNS